MQEIEFFEEGEPMIDGEPGDLKVKALDCVALLVNTKLLSFLHWMS